VIRAFEISGVFCVVRAMHKFDFWLLINEASNSDEWKGDRLIGIQAFDRLCTFSADAVVS
jgi:hypothetical protein